MAGAALSAYLIGTMTNEAWVNRNFHGIVVIGIQSHRRRKQAAHVRQTAARNMSFDRHSSEFIARMTPGANAVSSVINLLIAAVGSDLMSLIGFTIVMVTQDPVMSLGGFVVVPPSFCANCAAGAQCRPPTIQATAVNSCALFS